MCGLRHECTEACKATSDESQYFIMCSCVDGCEVCDNGKIHIRECPYSLIDDDVSAFNYLYQAHKSGIPVYGTAIETPHTLLTYFNILESELTLRKELLKNEREETEAIAQRIMRGKNG